MNTSPEPWPVVLFPDISLTLLIYGSLILTGIGAVALIWMLIRDRRNKQIW